MSDSKEMSKSEDEPKSLLRIFSQRTLNPLNSSNAADSVSVPPPIHSLKHLSLHAFKDSSAEEITKRSYSGLPSTPHNIGSSSSSEIQDLENVPKTGNADVSSSNLSDQDRENVPKVAVSSSKLSDQDTIGSSKSSLIPSVEDDKLETVGLKSKSVVTASEPSLIISEQEVDEITKQPYSDFLNKDPISSSLSVVEQTGNPLNTTTSHVKGGTSSTPEYYDDPPFLKVTTVLGLVSLPPKLVSLKIEGLESLEEIPAGDLLPPALRRLYLITCSSLKSFPCPASLVSLHICDCMNVELLPSIESGQLACLHFLYIGNSCHSLTNLTLDLFPQLKTLFLRDCPNLVSLSVSDGFSGVLTSLQSLNIKNCFCLKSFPDQGLPTPNLTSMSFSNCPGLDNLPNLMNSLTSLRSFYLRQCSYIRSLPSGGLPSSLQLLSIAECYKLTPQKDWGLVNLDSLVDFQIEGDFKDLVSFPEEKLLPSGITRLRISNVGLKELNYKGLQLLNALETLEVHSCRKLRSLPEEGLPYSLRSLCVKKCPKLAEKLKPESENQVFASDEWYKVERIPRIQIDDQVFCGKWAVLS